MNDEKTLADIDAERVILICKDVEHTKMLRAFMEDLIEENVTMQTLLVEGPDESRINRLGHLASQISAYRRIKDASIRALERAEGKPPEGVSSDLAGGGVL